jgi:Uma2 family endonuclease
MAVPTPRSDYKYTYADYLLWPDEERWEIIDGIPYDMSAAPNSTHQRILMSLSSKIYNHIENRKCEVFPAPFDVRLSDDNLEAEDFIDNVVQPDISVICDPGKIDEKGCLGAPDICIEILSPSTAYKDQTEKLKLYEKFHVKEYWIINPGLSQITVYVLEKSEYSNPKIFKKKDVLKSTILESLEIDLQSVFLDEDL